MIELSRQLISGFTSVLKLDLLDQSLVHLLVCARLAQSVTMGAYSFSLNPENTYLLVTAQPGWKLLERLALFTDDEIRQFNGF